VPVLLKVFPQNYSVVLEGVIQQYSQGPTKEWRRYNLPMGQQQLVLQSPKYQDRLWSINVQTHGRYEAKLERQNSALRLVAELPSGPQPKSLIFSPDGQLAFAAQLDGPGLDVYTVQPWAHRGTIDFPKAYAAKKGFVEFAVLPWQNELWVSQMTTNMVHIITLSTLKYQRSLATGGSWPKVITVHPYRNLAFVSNWIGETVAVFDTISKKRIALWKTTGTPRGMVCSPDGLFLYVASFGTGHLDKFRISTGQKVKTINMGRGAKRHLVIHPTKPILYATDMELGEVWVFALDSDTLIKRCKVGPKLNSCDISPDGRFLFISSRGNNGPDYLLPGPDFGTISVMDTQTLKIVDWCWGRNQPTGLAVHPTLPHIIFSDFLDHRIEVYDFSALYAPESTEPRLP
jgi:DNA-binding beta-propeller fold protein YncE